MVKMRLFCIGWRFIGFANNLFFYKPPILNIRETDPNIRFQTLAYKPLDFDCLIVYECFHPGKQKADFLWRGSRNLPLRCSNLASRATQKYSHQVFCIFSSSSFFWNFGGRRSCICIESLKYGDTHIQKFRRRMFLDCKSSYFSNQRKIHL